MHIKHLIKKICIFFLLLYLCAPELLSAQTDSVTITEVMFNPNSTNNEFVEIYNYGSTPIDLTGWRLYDYQDVDTLKDFGQGLILAPKQFAVIF
ncbi:lamin tail domain-containing protein [bacterium]|nr:MAG: lamin tail domain-containing protein [bacterium]